MTERGFERWLVTCGAVSRPVFTRRGADEATLEIEVGTDDAARIITATIVTSSEDTCVVSIAGRSTVVRLAQQDSGYHAIVDGESFTVTTVAAASADSREGGGANAGETPPATDLDALAAPMPATVSAILVQPGAVVAPGDTLVRLEAMKMELAIQAPSSARVATVDCRVGDLVQPGRPLVTLGPRPAAAGEPYD